MTEPKYKNEISIHISRSSISTAVNKTGSWRFMRPKYDEKTAPCSAGCPAGEDIARIEMLAAKGLFGEALQTILLENPFPAVCGRVCFHPCETACNRDELDQPIAIHRLERFLGHTAFDRKPAILPKKLPHNGRKILIVGAGPAGLAAAYFLIRLGYSCDVFEMQEQPGGILRWGIPRYRLPGEVLKHEIDRIKAYGANIVCNTPIDRQHFEGVQKDYDAVFVGCGHGRSLPMNIPGQALSVDGLEFLKQVRKNEAEAPDATVAVIGGGNTAVDVARSLVRLGSRAIIVYRRRRQDMPAFAEETATALEEGVELMELAAPLRIDTENGDLLLTLQQMKIVAADNPSGRVRVVPGSEASWSLRVGKVITAIGAEPEADWQLPPQESKTAIRLSHCAMIRQEVPVVFGGDLTNLNKSVADAIASGKQAAMALDTLFERGWDAVEKRLADCRVGNGPALSMESYLGGQRISRSRSTVEFKDINLDYFSSAPGVAAPLLDMAERRQSFAEVERTLGVDQAVRESRRCFNCGICSACGNCRLFCPEVAVTFAESRCQVNLEYCKGCGICVVECPRNVMDLEEEI